MKRLAIALLCSIVMLPLVAAEDVPRDAQAILARARQSAGGAAWDSVRSIHTRMSIRNAGLDGTASSIEDTLTGRYVERFDLGATRGAQGFDGTTPWLQDASGQVVRRGGDDANQAAANETFRRSLSYWFADRVPAQIEYAGRRDADGRSFDAVRATPRGGRPFELWVASDSGLIERVVEKVGVNTRTTYFSDFREVDGRRVPFAVRSGTGEALHEARARIESIEFNAPLAATAFAIPESVTRDHGFAGKARSTTLPFQLVNNHIYLDVRLNSGEPVKLLFDSGGANLVTPTLAGRLGLQSAGSVPAHGAGEKTVEVALTRVARMELGAAWLSDQQFVVFPLESFADVEGIPTHGVIGFEVFKRFVVEIDYERYELTLHDAATYKYTRNGSRVPFEFTGHGRIPAVQGSIDGIAGTFTIDTGARNSLTLFGPFVEKNDLAARYAVSVEGVTGWGVGGPARSRVARAREFRLGDIAVAAPVIDLTQQKRGMFADSYMAGNVGAGVLRRFHLVFDYAHQQIWFERNRDYATADVFDRAGLWINRSGDELEVVDVYAGGAAAQAGLNVGDRIVTIDGKRVGDALPDVRRRFRSEAAGTRMRLVVRSGTTEREAVLTLRDLL